MAENKAILEAGNRKMVDGAGITKEVYWLILTLSKARATYLKEKDKASAVQRLKAAVNLVSKAMAEEPEAMLWTTRKKLLFTPCEDDKNGYELCLAIVENKVTLAVKNSIFGILTLIPDLSDNNKKALVTFINDPDCLIRLVDGTVYDPKKNNLTVLLDTYNIIKYTFDEKGADGYTIKASMVHPNLKVILCFIGHMLDLYKINSTSLIVDKAVEKTAQSLKMAAHQSNIETKVLNTLVGEYGPLNKQEVFDCVKDFVEHKKEYGKKGYQTTELYQIISAINKDGDSPKCALGQCAITAVLFGTRDIKFEF